MKIADYTINWRGTEMHVYATVDDSRVQIYSLHETGARTPLTHCAGEADRDGHEVRALSGLTFDERQELYDLVWKEHHGWSNEA